MPKVRKVVRFGKGEKPGYFFDVSKSQKIEDADEERDLGIIFDNDLTFTKHIKAKIGKANSSLYFIKRCFRDLTPNAFCNLYKAVVRPHLEFCSPV